MNSKSPSAGDVSSRFNPDRLSFARRRRGLTKVALAQVAELSPRMLTHYEMGSKAPSTESLRVLAKELEFPVSFFLKGDLSELPQDTVSFRALSKMTARQSEAARAAGSLAVEFSRWIEERFRLPEPDIPDAYGESDPEAVANEVRVAWGLGIRPIRNMIHLLESRGVRVFSLSESKDVDAFSAWQGGAPFVFLNTAKSVERSRFDAAHELGHLMLHRHGSPRGREAEQQANEFASALLMPKEGIEQRGRANPSVRGVVEGKQLWGVSAMAYAFRLYRIGMLTDWHYHRLAQKMSALGYRKAEPAAISTRETSQVLTKVLQMSWSERISKTEIARDLGLYPRDLDRLVFGLLTTGESSNVTDSKPGVLRIIRQQ